MQVGKQMRAYEEKLYEVWRGNVEEHLPGLMRRNVLTKPEVPDPSPLALARGTVYNKTTQELAIEQSAPKIMENDMSGESLCMVTNYLLTKRYVKLI